MSFYAIADRKKMASLAFLLSFLEIYIKTSHNV